MTNGGYDPGLTDPNQPPSVTVARFSLQQLEVRSR
jgi:hypothetical protein